MGEQQLQLLHFLRQSQILRRKEEHHTQNMEIFSLSLGRPTLPRPMPSHTHLRSPSQCPDFTVFKSFFLLPVGYVILFSARVCCCVYMKNGWKWNSVCHPPPSNIQSPNPTLSIDLSRCCALVPIRKTIIVRSRPRAQRTQLDCRVQWIVWCAMRENFSKCQNIDFSACFGGSGDECSVQGNLRGLNLGNSTPRN